jgi:hypothetical protein
MQNGQYIIYINSSSVWRELLKNEAERVRTLEWLDEWHKTRRMQDLTATSGRRKQ